MEASFWHEKWELGHIGFHVNEANPLLVNHLDKLELAKNARIFLPLCGKTLDFAYLQELGYQTVGIELSELPIIELFEELNITPDVTTLGNFKRYYANNIEIFVGDFFDLSAEVLGDVDAIYDRASLIALPLETRLLYTKHLTAITGNASQLLVCVEYDQAGLDGPPFSISTKEVQQHYDDLYNIDCVDRNEIEGGLKKKIAAEESAWILSAK